MATQLFVTNNLLRRLLHFECNGALILRWISLTYALTSILFIYVFVVSFGLSQFVGLLASFFLAFAPLHIISSHFGTADMTVMLLFYATMFAAWRYRLSCQGQWLYAAIALSGVAMADKFFLPVLIGPALIVLFPSSGKMWSGLILSACVFTAFFCAACFFNYTPWHLKTLAAMLWGDDILIEGGNSHLQQVILYSWDMIPCSGVVTSTLALIGGLAFCHRVGFWRLAQIIQDLSKRRNVSRQMARSFSKLLRSPASILIAPLIFHAFLVVMAQVHAPRFIFIFVPVICLLAAIGVDAVFKWSRSVPFLVCGTAIGAVMGLMIVQVVDGFVTDKVYSGDIRIALAEFLNRNRFTRDTETFISYTYLKNVSLLPLLSDRRPTAPIFITCDIEYARYLSAGRGTPSYHVFGGIPRVDFFVSLFSGRASYTPVFNIKRKRESLEDRLAGEGWLPELDTFVPNECYAFRKQNP